MAKGISIIVCILMFLLFVNVSWSQESTVTITDMKAEPSAVNPGDKVLISCRVTHSAGPMNIEGVAATVFHGDWVTSYPYAL